MDRCPITKLNGSNFSVWRMGIQSVLRNRDLWNTVFQQGQDKEPPSELPEWNKQQCKNQQELDDLYQTFLGAWKQYRERQLQAYDLILLCCEEKVYFHLEGLNSGTQAWDKLVQVYERSSQLEKSFQFIKFWEIKYHEGKMSMSDQLDELQKLANTLARHGHQITDDIFISKLILFLPQKFENLKAALASAAHTLTKLEVIQRILEEDLRQSSSTFSSSSSSNQMTDVAMAVTSRNVPCPFCSIKGHGESECLKKKGIICKNCHKLGHYEKDCYRKKQKNKSQWNNKKREKKLSLAVVDTTDTTITSAEWLLDSAAAKNFCCNKAEMKDLIPTSPHEIESANGQRCNSIAIGNVWLNTKVGSEIYNIKISNVHYVPGFKHNLLSVHQILKKGGSKVEFTADLGTVRDSSGAVIIRAHQKHGVYVIQQYKSVFSRACHATDGINIELIHKRLAHLNYEHIKKLPSLCQDLVLTGEIPTTPCEGCLDGKQHRIPFANKAPQSSSKPLELIHSDIWGKAQIPSRSKMLYYLTFIDDFTRFTFTYCLRERSEFLGKFKMFKALAENQHSCKIKSIRYDNAGENLSSDVLEFLNHHGIKIDVIPPYTPQLNGVAERANRTLMEKIRSMLSTSGLPLNFWAEALLSATHMKNISPTSSLPGLTPFEAWYKKKPNLKNLRVFGCRAYVHVPDNKRKKLSPKSNAGILIGHVSEKEYRILLPDNSVVRSRDVVFNENLFPAKSFKTSKELPQTDESPIPVQEETSAISSSTEITSPPLRRSQRFTPKIVDDDFIYGDEIYSLSAIIPSDEPSTYNEALKSPDAHKWKPAIDEEYNSLLENETFISMPLPVGHKAIGAKWVFKKKTNPQGQVVRFKARLVAQGYAQTKGIDYNETFASVAKFSSIRTLFALASSRNMDLIQLDVKTAFLHGVIEEDVYIRQIEGFIDKNNPDHVLKLKKSLYGLKQAPRAWYERLAKILSEANFIRSNADFSVFVKQEADSCIILAFYVDDILIASDNTSEHESVVQFLKSKFSITVLGEPSCFVGIQIDRNRSEGTIKIHQAGYIQRLLSKFNMLSANPISTPADPHVRLQKSTTEENVSFPYSQAVGALLYLAIGTRPDIAFAVGVASRYMCNPSKTHVTAVQRIFRYLLSTPNLGLTFSRRTPPILEGFCDADWANDIDDRKSIGAYIFTFCGSVISWSSKKQTCVATSTTDAEYMSLSQAAREALWIQKLFKDLNIEVKILKIYCDNSGAVSLASNPQIHQRTKHIDIIHHFVREKVLEKSITVERVPSSHQLADILTKPLAEPLFSKCVLSLIGSSRAGILDQS